MIEIAYSVKGRWLASSVALARLDLGYHEDSFSI